MKKHKTTFKMLKTIDIQVKEWFDRVNGNSYFSGIITLNFGYPDVETFIMSFQCGYGDQYIYEAKAQLTEHNRISADYGDALWKYCEKNNIILRTSKQENCLKRDVVNYVS